MFLLLAQLVAYAQGGQVKGNVNDSMGEPVIGATVTEAGNPRNATVTDYDGNFVLQLSSKGRQVVVSYVGMKTKTVQATPGSMLSVSLVEDANTLGEVEVVSVGYGQARRRDLTGSISSVGEKTLRHITTTNAASAITGRLAGVNVVTTQGSPDADVTIRVRGGGSITQNNEPLYIVDGFQVSNINDIPVTDIESIDVLKDASSTAIYGAKGANGVILVTTKSGKSGKTEVTFNASLGLNKCCRPTSMSIYSVNLTMPTRPVFLSAMAVGRILIFINLVKVQIGRRNCLIVLARSRLTMSISMVVRKTLYTVLVIRATTRVISWKAPNSSVMP